MLLMLLAVYWCFTEVKQDSRNRLSHIPCQQSLVTSAVTGVCGTMANGGMNDGSLVMPAENVGQYSSRAAAWPSGAPGGSVTQTAFSSSLQSAAASSQSSGFQCSQNAPLSGLSHTSNLQIPSQPFDGYDGSAQLQSSVQNHTSPSTNSSVCYDSI